MKGIPRRPRTPEELLKAAHEWVRKTGWPTYCRDNAIADGVYEAWIKATDAEWAATQSRSYERLIDMIAEAFAGLHGEETIDHLQILLSLDLTLRGRQEGKLKRRSTH